MLNCKHAAMLMSQQMDDDIGLLQKINLRFHLMMCGGCRNFEKQVAFLHASCEKFIPTAQLDAGEDTSGQRP